MTPQQLIDEGLVPAWVNYLAQDGCGDWYGFNGIPHIQEVPTGPPDFAFVEIWDASDFENFIFIASDKPNPRWRETLFAVKREAA